MGEIGDYQGLIQEYELEINKLKAELKEWTIAVCEIYGIMFPSYASDGSCAHIMGHIRPALLSTLPSGHTAFDKLKAEKDDLTDAFKVVSVELFEAKVTIRDLLRELRPYSLLCESFDKKYAKEIALSGMEANDD